MRSQLLERLVEHTSMVFSVVGVPRHKNVDVPAVSCASSVRAHRLELHVWVDPKYDCLDTLEEGCHFVARNADYTATSKVRRSAAGQREAEIDRY
jgi:hypothetical protein